MSSLKHKVFSGVIWSVGLRLFIKTLGLINTIILARLLAPDDFGIIAIVMSVYAFLEMLKAFGFDVVLIQNQQADHLHYNTAWTLQLLFGVIAATAMFIAGPFIAVYYNDARIVDVAKLVAVMFLLNGAVNIGVVNFRKDLNFRKEFYFTALTKIITVAITVVLAFIYRNYWALVIGSLISRFFELVLSYVISNYRPWFSLAKTREIFGFSFWLVLNNMLQFVNSRSQDLLVGKVLNLHSAGLLKIANEIAALPTTELVASVNRATFPGYSKISQEPDKLKRLYLDALGGIAMIGIPCSLGIALVAPIFVPVVLGSQWMESIVPMQIFCLSFLLMGVNTNAIYIFHAQAKPLIPVLISLLRISILLPLLYWLVKLYGLNGAALAMLTTSSIMFPIYYISLRYTLNLGLREYLSALIRPILSSGLMFFAASLWFYGNLLAQPATDYNASLIDLIVLVTSGALCFVLFIYGFWILMGKPEGTEKDFQKWLKTKLNSRLGTN